MLLIGLNRYLKSFIRKVKKECELENKELMEAECISKGHNYSEWKKINYLTLERNPLLDLGLTDYIILTDKICKTH